MRWKEVVGIASVLVSSLSKLCAYCQVYLNALNIVNGHPWTFQSGLGVLMALYQADKC